MLSEKHFTCSPISEKYFKGVTPAAKEHLLSSLRNLESGVPPTPSFKLYGKADWSVVETFLKSVNWKDPKCPKWLLEYEESRKEKFGPQGGHAPWSELKENAQMYFERITDCSEDVDDEELEIYSSKNIHMLSPHEAMETLKNDDKIQDRAAGWRDFNLKKTDPIAQQHAVSDVRSGIWLEGWAYYFSRFNKNKKRLFVPMPFSSMIAQAQYFNPFLKVIQEDIRLNLSASKFAFWGDKIGFGPLFHDILEAKFAADHVDPTHVVWVMVDFEKMDTTMGPSQKEKLFVPKVAAALHFGKDSLPYQHLLRTMVFSNQCPIATPEGMWTGSHGEASGATVTNGGETCANEHYNRSTRRRLRKLAEEAGIVYREIYACGNGDDGMIVLYLEDLARFDEFAKLIREAAAAAAKACGFRIQEDKWDIHLATYGKYCQYLIDWDGSVLRAMYPAALILNSIINPEKEYTPAEWDKDYRDIDIIEKLDNGRELPYFHQLIDYVDNGMKYRLLGQSEAETRRILSKYERYRALQGGSREFNTWDNARDSISSSPTVQYLLSKRGYHLAIE